MRDLKPSKRDTIEFIKEVINKTHKRKTDETNKLSYKERCLSVVSKYRSNILEYDQKMSSNKLEDLVDIHPSINPDEKEDYKSLYGYKNSSIKKIRDEILISNGYIDEKCPLCEVNTVQTMDHFIPQTKFPLYSINPKNLIPSCWTCNVKKSETVLDVDKRKYWNVYLDKVPVEKFLYCSLEEKEGILCTHFYIQQNGIDDNTFRLLNNSMIGQDILQTYSDGSGWVIAGLINEIIAHKKHNLELSFDEIFFSHMKLFSYWSVSNKWDEVLKFELLKSDAFKKLVQKEYERLNKK